MPYDKLTGVQRYADSSFVIRELTGIVTSFEDNLSVIVQDSSGVILEGVTITIDEDGLLSEYTLPKGIYYDKIDAETNFTITAELTDYRIGSVTFIHDGVTDLSIVITLFTGGEPCFSKNPENRYSFLRFYKGRDILVQDSQMGYLDLDTEEFVAINSPECQQCANEIGIYLPNNYRRNYKNYIPSFPRNKELSFIVNSSLYGFEKNLSGVVARLIDHTGEVIDYEINYDVVESSDGNSLSFKVFFTPTDSLPSKKYRIAFIDNNDSGRIGVISNQFYIASESESNCLIELKYRHSNSIFGFNYDDRPDEYNIIWLHLNMIESQPEIELKQTREYTTGVRRSQRIEISKVLTLESYYFDDETNDAMLALSAHDDIRLNGKVVTVKEAFQIITDRRNSVQKGTIEFYDQSYSTVNLSG